MDVTGFDASGFDASGLDTSGLDTWGFTTSTGAVTGAAALGAEAFEESDRGGTAPAVRVGVGVLNRWAGAWPILIPASG
ncbi:hypothetical protein [Rhodococcoides yunnanense]|uniref:hypothetical protein n=1 Tax=Rhodococcoides yunnanense TaxID=278209 RepID=UPI0014765F27|nr:hypothetical protein [Rhodococcus yunnanensis]